MRTIRTKVYKFNELNKAAQEKAIESLDVINVNYNWWESSYEDAQNIGLNITEFDFDSASFIRNVKGEFTLAANEVAANIFRDHGEECDTYKTAQRFMNEWDPVFAKYIETEEHETELMDIEEEFLNDLLEDYKGILQEDYNYRTSKEAIRETIEANEYEFTADGRMI